MLSVLHVIAPWPLERTCWRQFAAQGRDCRKSRIAPLKVVVVVVATAHVSRICITAVRGVWHANSLLI